MNAYTLTLLTLVAALLAQTLISVWAIEGYRRTKRDADLRHSWLAIAIGSLLLALHHGYTLELAWRTGLYDLRQATLASLAALFFAIGIYGFRRRPAGTPPLP